LPFSPPSDFKFSTPEIEHVLVVGVLEVVGGAETLRPLAARREYRSPDAARAALHRRQQT
jgi:hypothetical protein